MNNQFGGFDIDSLGTVFQRNGVPASVVPNSQQLHYGSNSGPCMDSYDPSRVLGGTSLSSYSTGRSADTSTNTASTLNTSNNSSVTHQTLMPAGIPTVPGHGTMTMGSSRHSSTSHNGASSNPFSPLTYDPLANLRPLHQPTPQAQHQPVVNQHLHQHQHVHHHHHHHLAQPTQRQYRKQHHQQPKHSNHRSSSSSSIPSSSTFSSNIFALPQHVSSLDEYQSRQLEEEVKKKEKASPTPEPWMEELKITVAGVSLEPMSGFEVIKTLQERTTEVLTRYLPCVHFLVQCQQDLRKGLAAATQKRLVHHMLRDSMTPRQFYTTFIANLPKRFYQENRRIMSSENLNSAYKELQKLCASAKAAESQGCEVVKNTFLGGMKDGESWGLRKWLSKQGGALYICNDTECLLNSCQKLDRSKDTTAKLAARLRPLAKNALTKLKNDVPSSYQEQSSAHPYLPFFHRLESALRGMSNFDPEDDDVICIDDDDEVEELKTKPPPPPKPSKRKSGSSKTSSDKPKRKASDISKTPKEGSAGGGSGDAGAKLLDLNNDSDLEILDGKPSANKRTKVSSPIGGSPVSLLATVNADDSDYMKALLSTLDDDNLPGIADFDVDVDVFDKKSSLDNAFPMEKDAYDLATGITQLSRLFDSNQQEIVRPDFVQPHPFWDEGVRYAKILKMFSDLLRDPDTSTHFLDPVNNDQLKEEGKIKFSTAINNPLCFRDIVTALLEDFSPANNTLSANNGILPFKSLSKWNMYNGTDLLQAIDLVFLNILTYEKACGEGTKSPVRSLTNKFRKKLWAFITQVIDEDSRDEEEKKALRKSVTRRSEGSRFITTF